MSNERVLYNHNQHLRVVEPAGWLRDTLGITMHLTANAGWANGVGPKDGDN